MRDLRRTDLALLVALHALLEERSVTRAAAALAVTQPTVSGMLARLRYIDRVAAQCVNTLAPKWSARLAAFDVFIWDPCYAMEQSLRID